MTSEKSRIISRIMYLSNRTNYVSKDEFEKIEDELALLEAELDEIERKEARNV